MAILNFPILYVPDPLKSRSLFNGQIFVGEPDLDPEIPVNQKQLNVVQEDGAVVPVSQPFILSSGGVPVYNGSPVRLDVDGNYSLKILSKNNSQEYYIDNVFEGQPVTEQELIDYVNSRDFIAAKTVQESVEDENAIAGQYVRLSDRGYGLFQYQEGQAPNGYNIIASTGVPSLSLVLIVDNFIDAAHFGVGVDGIDDSLAWQAAVDYSWENRSTISTNTPTPLADYSVIPIRIRKGEYNFTVPVEYEPAMIWIGDEVQINPPTGQFAFIPKQSSSGYRFYAEGITINGESGFDLDNNNIDTGKLIFNKCKFFGCDEAVRTNCQSSGVYLFNTTWYQCKKFLNILSGDLVLVSGGWMKQTTMDFNQDASIENNGKLVIMDMIGVPNATGGFTETAWINNRRDLTVEGNGGRTGLVELYHTRFGGETGSKTIVNNFATTPTGASPTPTGIKMVGCDVYAVDGGSTTDRGVIRLFAMPGSINMSANTGFTDTRAISLGTGNTVASDISGSEGFYSVSLDNSKMPAFAGYEDPSNNYLPEFYPIESVAKQINQTGFGQDLDTGMNGWSGVSSYSSGNSVLNLPDAVQGLEYTAFRTDGTFQYRFVPQSGDTIRGASAAGKQLRIATQYVGITLKCYIDGFWEIKETINTSFGSADYEFEP